MILLGTGDTEDIVLIVIVLLLLFISLSLINKKVFFKILAKLNKLIMPSLYKKDISKLKAYEKVILVYRYWITKKSL